MQFCFLIHVIFYVSEHSDSINWKAQRQKKIILKKMIHAFHYTTVHGTYSVPSIVSLIVEFNIFQPEIQHFENFSTLIEKYPIRQLTTNYNGHRLHTLITSLLLIEESKQKPIYAMPSIYYFVSNITLLVGCVFFPAEVFMGVNA